VRLPKQYHDLATYRAPRMLIAGLATYGTQEIVGAASNPIILSWAYEVGVDDVYTNDDIAWCGLWMAVVAKRSAWVPVPNPLWARNWLRFGQPASVAMLGDILVFNRPGGGGHVGVYVGEDTVAYHVLGGNQQNTVNITRIRKNRLLGVRRPKWRSKQPDEVKQIFRTAAGIISVNED
jgi:uncharacterized protein (TIGR02594 family)